MEDKCPKAQLQVVATVDNPADQNKSALYSCRVGKGYLRFGDDKPVNAEPDADGRYTIKILVDCTTMESYFFVNGGKNPVITRKPILINKTQNYVTFGDGSVAVEGKCRIFDISVNAF